MKRPATTGKRRLPPFQRFLDETAPHVFRFLLASVGPDDVDDCFQETFLSALRAYPNLRHADNLRGWVLAIATRKVIDNGRARSRLPVPSEEVEEVADRAEHGRFAGEAEVWLWDAVRRLPARQRVAVVHRIVLDRPYPELAAAMGCSVETARANVYQGLRKLRDAWRSNDES